MQIFFRVDECAANRSDFSEQSLDKISFFLYTVCAKTVEEYVFLFYTLALWCTWFWPKTLTNDRLMERNIKKLWENLKTYRPAHLMRIRELMTKQSKIHMIQSVEEVSFMFQRTRKQICNHIRNLKKWMMLGWKLWLKKDHITQVPQSHDPDEERVVSSVSGWTTARVHYTIYYVQ